MVDNRWLTLFPFKKCQKSTEDLTSATVSADSQKEKVINGFTMNVSNYQKIIINRLCRL